MEIWQTIFRQTVYLEIWCRRPDPPENLNVSEYLNYTEELQQCKITTDFKIVVFYLFYKAVF